MPSTSISSHGNREAVNPAQTGTKAAAHYHRTVAPGEEVTIRLRLTNGVTAAGRVRRRASTPSSRPASPRPTRSTTPSAPRNSPTTRAACSGRRSPGCSGPSSSTSYDVTHWLDGDSGHAARRPPQRKTGRNHDWRHVNCADVISMPDTWEYPWFAAWDLAFHCIPLAVVDPQFAKEQLLLLDARVVSAPERPAAGL